MSKKNESKPISFLAILLVVLVLVLIGFATQPDYCDNLVNWVQHDSGQVDVNKCVIE